MKKLVKKTVATALSMVGILSMMPSALCVRGEEGQMVGNVNQVGHLDPFNAMVVAKYFNSIEDFQNLEMVNKKYRMTLEKFRFNPFEINPNENLFFLPRMETCHVENFRDQNFVYTFPNDRVRTIIYFPTSFNLMNFTGVLVINGITNQRGEFTDKWERDVDVIGGDPLNGCRITFTNKDNGRRIIFLFDPCFNGRLANVDMEGNRSLFGIGIGDITCLNDYNRFLIKCKAEKAVIPVGEEFSIPSHVTSIGTHAFWGWKTLRRVIIPDSVKDIGQFAFCDCGKLTDINIPNSVTSIGDGAFEDCVSLNSIEIPNSVTSIGENAFVRCSRLKKVTIPDSVTKIGMDAFAHCENLTEVTIPNSVESVECGTFSGCKNLTKVTIPNSVTSIGVCAFKDCINLREITIPDSVTRIRMEAFDGCRKLRKINIPTSVKTIDLLALYGCRVLRNIEFNGKVYKNRDSFMKAFEEYRASQDK